jgi:flagellar basal-body rod protein FlgG
MSDALSIAASGLKSEEFYIDKIANDLANLNTSNYKASKLTFEDALYQNSQQAHIQIGVGTAIYQSSKDFSQGPLKASNNWNDVAINGHGFYQLIQQDGSVAYTRNSSFSIDEERYLTTQGGLRLQDNIQIPDDFVQLKIKDNGDVEVTLSDDPEPQLLGTIQLAKFANPEALTAIGNGVYLASDQSGDPLIDNPGSSGLGQLAQQQIEGSNVDMVDSLMQLTMAQRVYQLNAKTIQIADELEKLTNEIRS